MNDTNAQQLDEILDRVRRIETRLCVLMEHIGLTPKTDKSFGEPMQRADLQESDCQIK